MSVSCNLTVSCVLISEACLFQCPLTDAGLMGKRRSMCVLQTHAGLKWGTSEREMVP